MGKLIDLTGQTFGKVYVRARAAFALSHSGHSLWLCDCACGTTGYLVSSHNLRIGKTRSCGCGQLQFIRKRRATRWAKPQDEVAEFIAGLEGGG